MTAGGVGQAQGVVCGAFIAMSHTYTGESLALFSTIAVLHGFGEMVRLFGGEVVRVVGLSGGTRLIGSTLQADVECSLHWGEGGRGGR